MINFRFTDRRKDVENNSALIFKIIDFLNGIIENYGKPKTSRQLQKLFKEYPEDILPKNPMLKKEIIT